MENENKKPDIKLAPKLHPLLASLPDYLKDPRNFDKVRIQILNTLSTSCSHGDLLEYSKCVKCTKNMLARRRLLKKLGFTSPMQYMLWQQVHSEIRKKMPLMDWKKENAKRLVENLKKQQ